MQYVMTFLEGVLAFLSPCILPMLPVYLIYLAGGEESNNKRLIVNTLAFVAGFTTLFVLLGASATSVGSLLSSQAYTLRIIGGSIMVIMGIFYLELPFIMKLKARLPQRKQSGLTDRFTDSSKPLRLGGSYLFGAAYSLTWAPCLSTWLSAAMIQASQADTVWNGILLLLLFSLGLGLPFIITSVLFDQAKKVLNGLKKHMVTIKRISGALLIAAGVAMILNLFDYYARLFN
ncbi:MAG: cytochrome c biogenesis protein CcdA [Verrucomicrobiae bacterium]|nr:cytochrome c biogenesis protein CcdA [Verrucomicrobiae bacterium]